MHAVQNGISSVLISMAYGVMNLNKKEVKAAFVSSLSIFSIQDDENDIIPY